MTMHTEEERLMPLLRTGACGYLARDASERELVDAIRVGASGDVYVQPKMSRLLATRAGARAVRFTAQPVGDLERGGTGRSRIGCSGIHRTESVRFAIDARVLDR